jgi:polysaccharide biosynthesis protein PslG
VLFALLFAFATAARVVSIVTDGDGGEGEITKGTVFHSHWRSLYPSDRVRAAVMDELAAAHVAALRVDLAWDDFEPTRSGEWNQSSGRIMDSTVELAHARGLKVLIMLWRPPAWARPPGTDPSYPPTDAADFAAFARVLAVRYGDRLAGIEIWNEPDRHQRYFNVLPTQDRYIELARLTKATKAALAGTGVRTVMPGASSIDDEYYSALFDQGGLTADDYDVANVHSYQGKADEPPDHPDDRKRWWLAHLPALYRILAAHGDSSKPVWITEHGYSTNFNAPDTPPFELGVSEAKQAEYLERSYSYVRDQKSSRVEAMYWYNEVDACADRYNNQCRFGLLRQDRSAKPALAAMRKAGE